ncbi:uncharacterized protein LOC116340415 [Contarinia nasturtii]|uniref:uncharacterized protein LOC116340415 n=1 Tax=Contarinia nasturtii TaxID=265458 RepID=UPI0012D37567|nr:uncharacterized protein LOC116340415 [Contarinia nasturtii]XP_031622756.1 uncharacterized protein LOC116340415 [Contarinia nasturtii]
MHLRLVITLLFITLYVAMQGNTLGSVTAQPVDMSSIEFDQKLEINYFRQQFETYLREKEKSMSEIQPVHQNDAVDCFNGLNSDNDVLPSEMHIANLLRLAKPGPEPGQCIVVLMQCCKHQELTPN